jgi:nicotinamide mononucleotide (NMN) deamidase PncC
MAGAYVAPKAEKLRRLLDISNDDYGRSHKQVAESLAETVATATASQWAIAVGEPWKDDRGTDYVDVAFRFPDGRLDSRQMRFRGASELARSRLTTQLLDQLRRKLN